jgi:hypothetical protein
MAWDVKPNEDGRFDVLWDGEVRAQGLESQDAAWAYVDGLNGIEQRRREQERERIRRQRGDDVTRGETVMERALRLAVEGRKQEQAKGQGKGRGDGP